MNDEQAAWAAWAWVETRQCPMCDWSGMHWHWGPRRYRTVREVPAADVPAFDQAVLDTVKADLEELRRADA